VSCGCGDDYTPEWFYPPSSGGYPQTCPQSPLQRAAGCGMVSATPRTALVSGVAKEEVEMDGSWLAREVVAVGTRFLKDPGLREIYAPYIPELRAEALCGR
jgi:hypothetical protein